MDFTPDYSSNMNFGIIYKKWVRQTLMKMMLNFIEVLFYDTGLAPAIKNRAILEPQAIFNEIPASGFSFCSLLFLDIKKPQPLDFSKDCGAYFYYLALITRLLNNCSNPT